jgi:hypothetical protein
MNDLPIVPSIIMERQGSRREAFRSYDVTKAITHDHWATLSRFYAKDPCAFWNEADRAYANRGERLRDKIASLS